MITLGGKWRTRKPLHSSERSDERVVNWAQCDRCEKWRRLPDGPLFKPDALPEHWYCYMNPDGRRNTCDASEEGEEGEVGEEGEEAEGKATRCLQISVSSHSTYISRTPPAARRGESTNKREIAHGSMDNTVDASVLGYRILRN